MPSRSPDDFRKPRRDVTDPQFEFAAGATSSDEVKARVAARSRLFWAVAAVAVVVIVASVVLALTGKLG